MSRIALLLLTLVGAACVPVLAARTTSLGAPQSAPEEEPECRFDSDCHDGTCSLGRCWSNPPDSSSESCSFDSQCPGGSCRVGTCSPFPPDPPPADPFECHTDGECPGRACAGGHCQ